GLYEAMPYVFLPLWVLFGISFLLAVVALCVACTMCCGCCRDSVDQSDNEMAEDTTSNSRTRRRNKYLLAATPLLLLDLMLFPFILLLESKLSLLEEAKQGKHITSNISWTTVFVPLWIADAVLIVGSLVLLIFTIGGEQSATFSVFTVISFILILA